MFGDIRLLLLHEQFYHHNGDLKGIIILSEEDTEEDIKKFKRYLLHKGYYADEVYLDYLMNNGYELRKKWEEESWKWD